MAKKPKLLLIDSTTNGYEVHSIYEFACEIMRESTISKRETPNLYRDAVEYLRNSPTARTNLVKYFYSIRLEINSDMDSEKMAFVNELFKIMQEGNK